MATLLEGARVRSKGNAPSVREVCLVGGAGALPGPAAGGRLRRAGRVYRITSGRADSAGADARHYLHLASVEEG